jgi:hypothetical protein
MLRHFPKALLGAVLLGVALFGSSGSLFAKEQPIAFSHQLHVSQNGIACQYCHLYARRSYSSGVPPVSTCIGCHGPNEMKVVQPAGGSPELDKLRDYWAKGEPIPWAKVHDIPDFVRFPHKEHINVDSSRFVDEAGRGCDMDANPRSLECKLAQFRAGGDQCCQACHGNVMQMQVVVKVDQNFGGMGWCMECHLQVKGAVERKRAMNTLAGWFNAKENDAKREAAMHLVDDNGYHTPNMNDCFTCHY